MKNQVGSAIAICMSEIFIFPAVLINIVCAVGKTGAFQVPKSDLPTGMTSKESDS